MASTYFSWISVVLMASSLMLGCSGETQHASNTALSHDEGRHGHKGPHGPFALALQMELKPEQRVTIQKLADSAKTQRLEMKETHKSISELLSAQIHAGRIDPTAFDKPIADAQQKIKAMQEAHVQSILALHNALDSAQRSQLADAMLQRWSQSKDHEGHKNHKGPKGHHGGFHKMFAELDLTDAQKAEFKEIVKSQMDPHDGSMQQRHKEHKALIQKEWDAFRADTYTPNQAAFMGGAMQQTMFSKRLTILEAIVPKLTEAQRTKLAEVIQHPHHHGHADHADHADQ